MATKAITGKRQPLHTHRETGWHATDWTLCTFDPWVRKVGVNNQGVGSLWVSAGEGYVGARLASDHMIELKPGTIVDFPLSPSGVAATLSIWGADGATHPVGLMLMEVG